MALMVVPYLRAMELTVSPALTRCTTFCALGAGGGAAEGAGWTAAAWVAAGGVVLTPSARNSPARNPALAALALFCFNWAIGRPVLRAMALQVSPRLTL